MGSAFVSGWVSLPSQGEVYLEHGIPRQVWVPHSAVDVSRLQREIMDATGFDTRLGAWQVGEAPGEMEAPLSIKPEEIDQVLERLAHSSAMTFYERYRKPLNEDDTDFDAEAYSQDINAALAFCGLGWSDVRDDELRQKYRRALYRASEALAGK